VRHCYQRHVSTTIETVLRTAAAAVHVPDDIEVPDWVEQNVYLSHRVTIRTGMLRLDPYQRFPLRAIKTTEEVTLCWATQTGKTIIEQCFMSWCASERPGPMQYNGPDKEFVTKRSRNHIQPIFEDSPKLKPLLTGDRHDWTLYRYRLTTCNITLCWAGSASQMAGEAVMNMVNDEVDKWRDSSEKESSSFNLVDRRTGSFGKQRRVMSVSTPTTEDGPIWQKLITGTYHELHVPCPHCATAERPYDENGTRNRGWQILTDARFRFPPREKIGEDLEELCDWQVRIKDDTQYECMDCGKLIHDRDRWGMVMKAGTAPDEGWYPRRPHAGHISCHLPGWYARSSYNNFGNSASRMVAGIEDEQARQDYDNSDAARPYQRVRDNATLDLIESHRGEYERGTLPTNDPCIIIATADIHKRCHFWTVWALTKTRTYMVDHGKLEEESLDGLRELRERTYTAPNGTVYGVIALFPDAEYRSDEVINLHLDDEFIMPITGAARTGMIRTIPWESYPGSSKLLPHPVQVVNVNDQYFKEELMRRFEHGRNTEGEFHIEDSDWILPSDVSREFVRHMLGVTAVKVKDTRGVEHVELRKTGDDHYLDCAKYALAVRVLLKPQIRELGKPVAREETPRVTGRAPQGWET